MKVKYEQGQFEIADLQKRSSKFLQNINEIPERPSISYEEQLQHVETIKELLEQNAKFKVTIESLNSEIQKLVQEKQKLIEDLSASRVRLIFIIIVRHNNEWIFNRTRSMLNNRN